MPPREGIYGMLAEFNTPAELVHATEMAHRAGYRRMECYTPYPVEEAAEADRLDPGDRLGVPGDFVGGAAGPPDDQGLALNQLVRDRAPNAGVRGVVAVVAHHKQVARRNGAPWWKREPR